MVILQLAWADRCVKKQSRTSDVRPPVVNERAIRIRSQIGSAEEMLPNPLDEGLPKAISMDCRNGTTQTGLRSQIRRGD